VTVKILEVNLAKNQIALTMKSGAQINRTPNPQSQGNSRGNDARRNPPPRNQMPQGKAFTNDAMKQLEAFRKAVKSTAS
ncbi:MAG: hypothetical protein ABI551_09800, partial [Polyangiaceae bacterium]